MTWRQFYKLAITTDVLIIIGFWGIGIISGGFPAFKDLGILIFLTLIIAVVIPIILLATIHIGLYSIAKIREGIPKDERIWVVVTVSVWGLLAFGLWLYLSGQLNRQGAEFMGHISFVLAAISGLLAVRAFILIRDDLIRFKSIHSE